MNQNDIILKDILESMSRGFLQLLRSDGSTADPVTRIADYRPVGEIAKGLLYLGHHLEAERCFGWLMKQQKTNGSWHEIIHIGFDEENTLSTAVIGKCFLDAYVKNGKKEYLATAEKALAYVRGREFTPGHFVKAYGHYSDILNVNAACAAFFHAYLSLKKNPEIAAVLARSIYNIVRFQFKDGAFPYTRFERAFPYEDHLNVRDLYYHALTCYYLSLADPRLENHYINLASQKALPWLANTLASGSPRWRESKVIFTVGAMGFYGYAAYCFQHSQQEEKVGLCLRQLKRFQQSSGLFSRYEPPRLFDSLLGMAGEIIELETIAPTGYSLGTRLFRLRRRLAHDVKTRRKQQVSLFYSAQIYNALTECLAERR